MEIDTPSEDEAHTIFLTMNDRGLSLNSAEMMKAYIIQQVAESDHVEVNHQWQRNINRIDDGYYTTYGCIRENPENPAGSVMKLLIALVRCDMDETEALIKASTGKYAEEIDILLGDMEEEYLEEQEYDDEGEDDEEDE